MESTKKLCEYCKKTLPKFGIDRKNGKEGHGDWKGRSMHKKCFRDWGLEQAVKGMIERYCKAN